MFYNIGFTYTMVIYCHSMVITTVIWLYNTEWQYYHGMAVNYRSKKFYNIGHLVDQKISGFVFFVENFRIFGQKVKELTGSLLTL